MVLIAILILTEALTIAAIRQHFYIVSRTWFYIISLANILLSIILWIIFFRIAGHNSFYDSPAYVWLLMAFAGMICGVVFPRLIVIFTHFTGKLLRSGSGGHIRWLTNSGFIIYAFIFTVTTIGTLHGRFNFKFEEVTIRIKGLATGLDGLRIALVSDLHLAGFYHHPEELAGVLEKVNVYKPDLVINAGDFVTFGWREFGGFDTILSVSESRYGNFAIFGNHDAGTYHPDYTETDRRNNKLIIRNKLENSGYKVLADEFTVISIGDARLALIGVTTSGRHPDIFHGDIDEATAGLDSADLKILLTHDPNHWIEQVAGKRPDLQLTMSGHTHGMQMGIMTKNFKWSPSKYFYPNWNGLYRRYGQAHYVNRGLGVLAIPFRIWMPPEVTLITLRKE